MEGIGGQVAHLSERDILLLTFQQVQQMSGAFDKYEKATDIKLIDIDRRMDAIERKMQENDVIKAQYEARSAKLIKWSALAFTAVQIIITVIIYLVSKK